MKVEYVPGRGYLVRDARGRILAKELSREQLEKLLKQQHTSVLSQKLLETLK